MASHGAHATPQYYPGTGHYYEVVMDLSFPDWSAAQAYAEQLSWLGMSGYLASIASSDENQFIFQLSLGRAVGDTATVWEIGPWLGGYQLPGSPEPDEGWVWVTGEPWTFSAWADNQPDNNGWMGQNEMALCYWSDAGQPAPTWNDYTDSPPHESDGRVYGYVVEYGEGVTLVNQTTWEVIKSVFQ